MKAHFGSCEFRDYQPHHASVYLSHLAPTMTRNSLSHVRALMSAIFEQAWARGHATENPIKAAKVFNAAKPAEETPRYTVAEMAAIHNALRDEPMAQLFMRLCFDGLRPSETRAIRWEGVVTTNGILHVRRSAWRLTINEKCKTRKSQRTITIGSTLCAMLDVFRESHPSIKGYVFENERNKPLEPTALSSRVIRPALEAAGVEWKGFYAGRPGAETEMNRTTSGNSQITSHHFGHTKQVADSDYIKPLPDMTAVAANELDRALSQAIEKAQKCVSQLQ